MSKLFLPLGSDGVSSHRILCDGETIAVVGWILAVCSNNQVEAVLDPVGVELWLPSCRFPVSSSTHQLRRGAIVCSFQAQGDAVILRRPNDIGHSFSTYRRPFLVQYVTSRDRIFPIMSRYHHVY